MGQLRFGVLDAVNVRFAVSPLWETVGGLRALADPGRYVVHLPWIREALTLPQEQLPGAPLAALRLLARTAGRPSHFLTPPATCPLSEIEEELAVVLATPPELVREAVRGVRPRQGRPDPFLHRLAEEPERVLPELAEAVLGWWRVAVAPSWPRIRALLEADIAHRTRRLAEDGIQQVFGDLHPTLRWRDAQLLSPDWPAAGPDLDGCGITLVPSAFAHQCHLLTGHRAVAPAVVYPARGVGTLWQRRGAAGPALARLLGRSRAELLAGTSSPATTTQLAARTGLTPGAVSQHLAVLRDSGLVTSHRHRREVHYTVSDLGTALLTRV
ncbi:DUF5937 family protein [Kitasatospora sp. NPDC096147]|uniref:ArsR/SmtB family transcription factor n=1 Tax=Kitasatospora sp. NPDC096147 TaxID=3364093 RepID=UPI0037FD7913